MNPSHQKVAGYLAGNENVDEVSVTELKKLVAENPYFPVAQFLLAKKLMTSQEPGYDLQQQKALLYFSNPYWLDYQLHEPSLGNYTLGDQEMGSTLHPVQETTEKDDQTPPTPEMESIVPIEEQQQVVNHRSATSNDGHLIVKDKEEPEPATAKEEIRPDKSVGELITTFPELKNVDDLALALTVKTEDWSPELGKDSNVENKSPFEDIVDSKTETEVVEQAEEMAGVENNLATSTEEFLEEAMHQEAERELLPEDEHDKMFQNIKAMLDSSSEEADADANNTIVAIDPYYTIDYFASQGIKLDLEQNPKDQLGQNLKKFTHWLRHMKKLGPEDAAEAINRTETDADIQQIADSSNTVREVVTEAMASVLEKQGKKDKAIELYNKLSFLNPGKSVYFADKIKNLKGS